jgi:hypothetical protein
LVIQNNLVKKIGGVNKGHLDLKLRKPPNKFARGRCGLRIIISWRSDDKEKQKNAAG